MTVCYVGDCTCLWCSVCFEWQDSAVRCIYHGISIKTRLGTKLELPPKLFSPSLPFKMSPVPSFPLGFGAALSGSDERGSVWEQEALVRSCTVPPLSLSTVSPPRLYSNTIITDLRGNESRNHFVLVSRRFFGRKTTLWLCCLPLTTLFAVVFPRKRGLGTVCRYLKPVANS